MKMKRLLPIILIALLLVPVVGWATTYTVCSSGCDYTSIQAVFDNEDLEPGDIIEVRADTVGGTKTYTEKVSVTNTDGGSAAGYVTLRGRDGDTIIISVIQEIKDSSGNLWNSASVTWTEETGVGSNIWSAPNMCGSNLETPEKLYLDNVLYARAIFASDIDSTERWYYDATNDVLYVYATSNPKTFYSSMKGSLEKAAVELTGVQYFKLENLQLDGGYYGSLRILGGDHIVVSNCKMGIGSRYGISTKPDGTSPVSYLHIFNNEIVTDNPPTLGDNEQVTDGVRLYRAANHVYIHDNTIKNFEHTGIMLYSDDNTYDGIKYNYIYNNDLSSPDSGYCHLLDVYGVDDGSGGSTVHHNYIHANRFHNAQGRIQFGGQYNYFYYNMIEDITNTNVVGKTGIAQGLAFAAWSGLADCKYNHVVNNTFINCDEAGISTEDVSVNISNNVVSNNIVYNCGLDSDVGLNDIGIRIKSDTTVANNEWKNNCVYKSGVTNVVSYRGTTMSVVNWNTSDSNGDTIEGNIQSDPFLSPNSPCIDAGVKIAGIHDQADWQDLGGNMIHYGRAPDIGAYEAVTDVATAWGMLPWYGRKYCVRW